MNKIYRQTAIELSLMLLFSLTMSLLGWIFIPATVTQSLTDITHYLLAPVIFLTLLLWVVPRSELRRAYTAPKHWLPELAIGVAAAVVVVAVTSVWSVEFIGMHAEYAPAVSLAPLSALSVLLLGPLFEEGYFRGVLLDRFLVVGRPWVGAIFTGLLFVVAHGSLSALLLLPGLVVMVTVLKLWRRTIWAGLIVHILFNLTVFSLAGRT